MFHKKFKLLTFVWSGFDSQHRAVAGEITAFNIRFAKIQLQSQELTLKKVRRKFFFDYFKKPFSRHQISVLLKQLSLLISSNISLLPALNIIHDHLIHPRVRYFLAEIKEKIQKGFFLSTIMAEYPYYFTPMAQQLITIGEQTGRLDAMLEKIVSYQEKMDYFKHKVKKALLYPSIILIITSLVAIFLCHFILPEFEKLFAQFNTPLPLFTRLILHIGHNLSYSRLLLIFTTVITTFWMLRTRNFLIKIPWSIFKKVMHQLLLIQLTYTWGILLKAGIPLISALHLTVSTTENAVIKKTLRHMIQSIEQGQPFHRSIQITQLFPTMAIQMIAIGEEAGKLDILLAKLAETYEMEWITMIEKYIQWLEPTLLIGLAFFIGSFIIALYSPLFKLGMIL
jgi:type IV pilus assembly protein PilC